ncbi:hypothetical protein CONCODRAFT_15149 [Conidiobolus coronatus NRRL 28638]|uniref:DUF202 domain-containing protein n=1 Tax=Conidiobolus coronatus (strain ATCC 28846 / CBS 209.66 / NRRL 28638) TaxID=796925 RepID=A0A137PG34_CONC2|nr:hypothetical protein CONCODRAFT_15149 [Conidiobolus coronatus NRRL 28638]|eukprot:KXN73952.1 hypothetical protein CONCODRAFT_15149 [Conidiobolus coronatus NRRL 28638]
MSGQGEKNEMFYWSKHIDNKSSTARDHLANERTFLAWFRTSITLVVIGVAIDQIQVPQAKDTDRRKIDSLTVACGFIAGGILILLFGLSRFISIQNTLVSGKFVLSRIPIISTLIAFALILFLIIALCFNGTYVFN